MTNAIDLSAILLSENVTARVFEMEMHSSTLAIQTIGHTSIRTLMGRILILESRNITDRIEQCQTSEIMNAIEAILAHMA